MDHYLLGTERKTRWASLVSNSYFFYKTEGLRVEDRGGRMEGEGLMVKDGGGRMEVEGWRVKDGGWRMEVMDKS